MTSTPAPSDPGQVHHFDIDLDVEAQMSGDAHLLIYYIREDGETVADSIDFSVTPCVENNVRFWCIKYHRKWGGIL